MADSLFDLAARITADVSQHNAAMTDAQKRVLALAKEHEALDKKASTSLKNIGQAATGTSGSMSTLSSTLKNLSSGFTAMEGPMGGTAGRLRGISSLANQLTGSLAEVGESSASAGASMAGMAGPIGIAVVGIAATIAAVGLLAKGLFDLSVASADFQGKMFDLSQQTGMSVETLSALEIVAKTTGGSIEGISASLGIFQKKLEEAQDPTSKIAIQLKTLGVETNNTEQAFRQSLSALAAMPEGFQQTAAALELFGRGGKSILAILKETNGDLDGTMAKFKEMGILISTQDAKAADDFNDDMALLGFQIRAAGAVVVKEAIPAFKSMVDMIRENSESIKLLASVVGDLSILITGPLAGALDAVVLPMKGAIATANALRDAFFGAASAAVDMSAAVAGVKGMGTAEADVEARLGAGIAPGKPRGLFEDKIKPPRASGRSGSSLPRADEALHLFEQLQQELAGLTDKSKQAAVAQELLDSKYQGTHLAEAIKLTAQMIDAKKALIAISKQQADGDKALFDLSSEMRDAVQVARMGYDQYDIAIRKVMDGIIGMSDAEREETRVMLERNAELARTITLTRQRIALESTLAGRLERPRWAEEKNWMRNFGGTPSEGDETRRRKVNDLSDETKAKLRALAGDITNTLDQAIHDGFDKGIKEGFRSMALGFAQMLEQMAMQWLASSIFKMLSGALTPNQTGGQVTSGGGGFLGFLKNILPFIGSALGAGIGGGLTGAHGGAGTHAGSGIGIGPAPHGYAMGLDYVPYDNFPAILHKGERVMTAAENRKESSSGGHTFVFNISTQNAQSFMNYDTQRQMKSKLKQALTG